MKSKSRSSVSKQDTNAQVSRMIRSAMDRQMEMKYYEQTSAGTAVSTGSIVPVTQGVVLGDAVNQRNGNKITVKECEFTVLSVVNDLSTVRGQFVRAIYFTDTMNVGAFPALTDLLAAVNPASRYSSYQTQTKRFKIHFDKVFPLSINGPSSDRFKSVTKFNQQVTYTAATSVSAANSKNAQFFVWLSDQTVNYPSLQYELVLKYHDC